jgi:RNA polymerase sigma factor (sigma-70 family)
MHDDGGRASDPSSRPGLPNIGTGRHFSWSILEDLGAPEDHRRAASGIRLFDPRVGLLQPEEEQELGRRVRTGTDEATGECTIEARDAVAHLVLANLRLCIRPARLRLRHGQAFDDIAQNGVLGLIRAAEKFEPEFGNRFSTYAMFWIRQSMDRGVNRESRLIQLPEHVVAMQRRLEIAESRGLINDALTDEATAKIVRSDAQQVRVAREAVHEIIGLDEAAAEVRSRSDLDPRSIESDGDDPEVPTWSELVTDDAPPAATEALNAHIKNIVDNLPMREGDVIRLYYGLDGFEQETLESIADQFGLTRERIRQIRNGVLDGIRRTLAVERARQPDFDVDMNLDPAAIRALTSDEIDQHVAIELDGPARGGPHRVAPVRPVDPSVARRRVVRSILSDLRAATSTWSSGLLLEPHTEGGKDPVVAEPIRPLTEREPYDRRALVEALSTLVDDVGPDAIESGLLSVVRSVVHAALGKTLPDAEGLARLLRLLRFLGCSTDPFGYELVVRASPRATVDLQAGSRVASSWHFDENNPEHLLLRRELHRHGDRLELEWNSNFDEDLDLVIAESLGHRSQKTYSAVIAGVPICDIETFLNHETGRRLTAMRAPRRIPWTYVCRRCQTVSSRRRTSGSSCPTHCQDCAP